jgi:hypothetical protein
MEALIFGLVSFSQEKSLQRELERHLGLRFFRSPIRFPVNPNKAFG